MQDYRMLRDGGIFITEQVGAENDRELVELLLGKTELPFPEQYLGIARKQFRDAGFDILDALSDNIKESQKHY